MTIGEDELRERLQDEDDDRAEAALRQHFVPVPRAALTYSWCPAAELEPAPSDEEGWKERWFQRMVDLANETEQRLRRRRYQWRRRRHPDWPVIVSEGDSWVAHPFIRDLSDRLSDEDDFAFTLLSKGAAGDRLADVEREHDLRTALGEAEVRAMVLSGGGNDMLAGFEDLVTADGPGPQTVDWILEILEPHMAGAMCAMERVLEEARRLDPRVPIIVHGYDYLRVREAGKGHFLGPYFDRIGVEDHATRTQAIRCLVDRFNTGLVEVAGRIDRVRYVDLRSIVPDEEWADEIHPDKHGFARLGDVIARALLEEIG